jgi:hypothetical protein
MYDPDKSTAEKLLKQSRQTNRVIAFLVVTSVFIGLFLLLTDILN